MAAWLGLPGDTAGAAIAVAIADARRRQARLADLDQGEPLPPLGTMAGMDDAAPDSITDAPFLNLLLASLPPPRRLAPLLRAIPTPRSEEHTSELQSLMRISYAVFCLKKTQLIHHNN